MLTFSKVIKDFTGIDFTVGREGIAFIIGFIVGFGITVLEAENEPVTLPFRLTNFKCNNPYSSNLNSIFLGVNSV